MQGTRQPIIMIYSKPKQTLYFDSVREAARSTGISVWRILRGLEDPEGEIPNTRPRIYVDEAVSAPVDDISL